MYFSKTTEEEKMKVTPEIVSRMQEALRNLVITMALLAALSMKRQRTHIRISANLKLEERLCEGDFVDKRVIEFLLNKGNA